MITNSITSSISCDQMYLEQVGDDIQKLEIFWYCAARFGSLEALQRGYSRVWEEEDIETHGRKLVKPIVEKLPSMGNEMRYNCYGKIACDWNSDTCWAAARGGHLAVLQWARAIGYEWDRWTCYAASCGGHLSAMSESEWL